MKTILAAATIAILASAPAYAQEKPDPAPQTEVKAHAHKPDPRPADPTGKATAFRSCISDESKGSITEVETLQEWDDDGLRYEPGHYYVGSRLFFSDGTDTGVLDKCASKLGMKRHS